ncbi:MAG: TIGR00730 family Rossman fold protein [Acidobacteria bacterium]|nr:TIGR00730 family Rossman fold protein [Acidobacteriota bacterium]
MSKIDKPILASAPLAYENPAFLNSPEGRALRILSEYQEPLARFRRERIQDTVVFFGSARFANLSSAQSALQVLEKPGSANPAPPHEQPATLEGALEGRENSLKLKRARAAVEMARYYEDARKLAFLLTKWSMKLQSKRHRFVVTSGGGPGIMEAANLGACEAGGKTIGLNIRLPFEQFPNRYITPELNFEFHYFFMRKYWFAYLAKALVIFPGGFGTLDELFEILTLAQTEKLAKKIIVIIYGTEYWKRVLNLEALVDTGTISPEDKDLFCYVDTPEQGFEMLKEGLTKYHLQPQQVRPQEPEKEDGKEQGEYPEIAKTRG